MSQSEWEEEEIISSDDDISPPPERIKSLHLFPPPIHAPMASLTSKTNTTAAAKDTEKVITKDVGKATLKKSASVSKAAKPKVTEDAKSASKEKVKGVKVASTKSAASAVPVKRTRTRAAPKKVASTKGKKVASNKSAASAKQQGKRGSRTKKAGAKAPAKKEAKKAKAEPRIKSEDDFEEEDLVSDEDVKHQRRQDALKAIRAPSKSLPKAEDDKPAADLPFHKHLLDDFLKSDPDLSSSALPGGLPVPPPQLRGVHPVSDQGTKQIMDETQLLLMAALDNQNRRTYEVTIFIAL